MKDQLIKMIDLDAMADELFDGFTGDVNRDCEGCGFLTRCSDPFATGDGDYIQFECHGEAEGCQAIQERLEERLEALEDNFDDDFPSIADAEDDPVLIQAACGNWEPLMHEMFRMAEDYV